jgi:hypothetical protein
MKVGAIQLPSIRRTGSYVRSHRRHFRQQSDYTFCTRFDEDYGWRFDAHDEVFKQGNSKQDIIQKFDFPSSERLNVLRVLDDFNLNAFSLFDSEETLLETMWFREWLSKKKKGPGIL